MASVNLIVESFRAGFLKDIPAMQVGFGSVVMDRLVVFCPANKFPQVCFSCQSYLEEAVEGG